jgi:hypothetical protein
MKKRVKRDFCCCRSCKESFVTEADFLGHLSIDGYCRDGVDRVVREIAKLVQDH